MTTYFVTRHPGAVEWAIRQSISAVHIEHLDTDILKPGDSVIGTLPVHIAAQVCIKRARYIHLLMTIPPDARGHELTAQEMDAFGAELCEYHVRKEDQ